MILRDRNIIVCDCGTELNPEIVTTNDYIKYNPQTRLASCTKCGATGSFTVPPPPSVREVQLDSVSDPHRKDYLLNNGIVFEDFNNFSKWVNTTPAAGSIAKDITFSKSGSSGLRLNVTTPAGMVKVAKDICRGFGNTNHRLSMWIYLHDEVANYQEITVDLYNIYTTRYYTCTRPASRYNKGWNMLTISDNEWTTTTSASWTAMFEKVRIGVKAATGKTCRLTVSDMRMGMEFSPKIILRFDDAMAGVYVKAAPIMDARGIKGTIYATHDFVVSGNPNYCTLAQIQEMYANGHDIGNHGKAHTGLINMNYAQTLVEIGDNQNWLIENGFYRSARHFAVPNSQNTEYTQAALKVLGVLTSTRGGGTPTFMPNMDLHNIPGRSVLVTNPVATVTGWIDDAVLNGKTLVLMFHNIADVPDGKSGIEIAYEYATADFQAICDYLVNNDLVKYVVPMSEFYIGLNK